MRRRFPVLLLLRLLLFLVALLVALLRLPLLFARVSLR
jgi:hypothetical protein